MGETYRPINIELRLTREEALDLREALKRSSSAGPNGLLARGLLGDALRDGINATEGSKFPPPYRALVVGLSDA